nr:hypothetical protein QOL21_02585 [Acholeplasma laidlawii]
MNKDTKKKILITSIILVAIVGIFILLYFLLGLNKYFTDADFIKEKIESYGNLGKVIYILINLLQTTIIPVTNIPTIFAGTYVYGPFEGATLAIIGVLIGSVISFYVGRIFGTKLLRWILGDKELDKYLDMMKGREKVVFS